jgi:glycosyltransferase involved in cell wall biosynthesis
MRRPIRVLELRSAVGTGGGPEKTILLGTERTDARRFAVKVCYLRDLRDSSFTIAERAHQKVDYTEIRERHSFDPKIWSDLRRLVQGHGFDIVHAHDYKTDFFAYLLSRFEDVIPLATAHGWSGTSWRERSVYYPADRRLLARFPCVIAVSGEIRNSLVRAGLPPQRARVILNAIDPRLFRRDLSRQSAMRESFAIEKGAVVLGSVGRLAREKRIDLLFEALILVRRKSPQTRLLVAGTGPALPELRERAATLGLDSAVRFVGHVEDVIGFHHALDLYIQSSDREGTSNALLEAMALETPIVATDVGGTADLVRHGEGALLVPARDPGALAAAIDDALSDGEASRRRVRAARQRVEHELSFAARMAAVESIYEELVDRHAQRRAKSEGHP